MASMGLRFVRGIGIAMAVTTCASVPSLSYSDWRQRVQGGELFVWGGGTGDCFGGGTTSVKLPRSVEGLPRVTAVALGCCLSAAVSDQGALYALTRRKDADTMYAAEAEPVESFKRGVVSVAVAPDDEILVTTNRGYLMGVRKDSENEEWQAPRTVTGGLRRAHVKEIMCGTGHCIALSKFGDAFSWGRNDYGQLGYGFVSKTTTDAPKRIDLPAGTSIVKASCGDDHTALIDGNGHVWTFGSDQWGQAGHAEQPWSLDEPGNGTPRVIQKLGGKAAADVSCGGNHTVVVIRDGTACSFGMGRWGQLGHHNYVHFYPIHAVVGFDGTENHRAASVSAGANHSSIITQEGSLYVFGGNEFGQLGNNSLQPSPVPVRAKGQVRQNKVLVTADLRDSSAAIVAAP